MKSYETSTYYGEEKKVNSSLSLRVRISKAGRMDLTEEEAWELAKDTEEEVLKTIASNVHISPEILDYLSERDQPITVKSNVASNRNSPPSALMRLARDTSDYYIRVKLTKNPKTPDEAQVILSKDKYWKVRAALASSDFTDQDLLLFLVKDEDKRVRSALASNHSLNRTAMMLLTKDESESVRESLVKNHLLDFDILDLLKNDMSTTVLVGVVEHPEVLPDTISYILKRNISSGVNSAAISSPKADSEDLAYFYEKISSEADLVALSYNLNTPKNILSELSTSKNVTVREGVASNLSTRLEDLEILFNDEEVSVRACVAGNININEKIAHGAICDKKTEVVLSYLQNRVSLQHPDLLIIAIEHHGNNKVILKEIAARADLSLDGFLLVSETNDEEVILTMILNNNCPGVILNKLSKNSSLATRKQVAIHKNTPLKTLQKMKLYDRSTAVKKLVNTALKKLKQ